MLDNKTIDGLYALRLPAMAAALAEQRDQAGYQGLSFEERLGLLVDRELTDREDRRVRRYLKAAKLRSEAVVEDPGPGCSCRRDGGGRSRRRRHVRLPSRHRLLPWDRHESDVLIKHGRGQSSRVIIAGLG
jgi:hypothetical protein